MRRTVLLPVSVTALLLGWVAGRTTISPEPLAPSSLPALPEGSRIVTIVSEHASADHRAAIMLPDGNVLTVPVSPYVAAAYEAGCKEHITTR